MKSLPAVMMAMSEGMQVNSEELKVKSLPAVELTLSGGRQVSSE